MPENQKILKVAIAGLGVGSTQVLPAMEKTAGIRLVAAADFRKEALEAFREKYHGRVYDSVEKLCSDREIDAVWISTPNQFHCEHVIVAAEHHKHVVVEKPMALSIEECGRMVAAAEKNSVKLLCGHTQSFNPAIRAMRQVIQSGEIGRLCALNTWMYTDWMLRPRMPQELDLKLGGGVVYRQGPHQIDIIRLLGGGMLRSVRAMTGQWMSERPAPGHYSAFLEFENGIPATVVYNGYGYFDTSELTWGIGERHYTQEERVHVRRELRNREINEEKAKEAMRFGGQRAGDFAHGASQQESRARRGIAGGGHFFGITLATCERGDIRQSRDGLYIYSDEGQREIPVSSRSASRSSELQELYDAVTQDRPVYHDGRWGMATLEVCLAIMQSARERREISLTHQSPTRE
ncbi:MAG: Gfo/Idh/MocA family oxidoreductase [Deltaproteobacteria bacterium]|nr:Gfo/Idh/MocA family oxidoreductase [Deltaproteobacteria bacterium]